MINEFVKYKATEQTVRRTHLFQVDIYNSVLGYGLKFLKSFTDYKCNVSVIVIDSGNLYLKIIPQVNKKLRPEVDSDFTISIMHGGNSFFFFIVVYYVCLFRS